MKKKIFLIPLAMFMVTGATTLAACDLVDREKPVQPSDDTKTLVNIAVDTPPTKTVYVDGDSFDPTGLKIKATYTDGSSEIVNGWTVNKTTLTVNDNSVTISYTKDDVTLTTVISITVNPKADPGTKTLTGIAVTTQPTKLEYKVGEYFDKTGMVVTASYSNSETANVTANVTIDKDGVALTKDDTAVVVSYAEGDIVVRASISITVSDTPTPPGPEHAGTLEDPLTTAEAVTIANGLAETTDSKNPIASEGMYVKGVVTEFKETFSADYGNYSIVIGGDFTLWRIKNGPEFAKFNAGDIEVGDEVTAFVYIMNFKGTPESTSNSYVHSVQKAGDTKTLQSIEIVGSLTKTSYVEGQTYSSAGLSVKGHYDDGSEGTVAATITLNKTIAALGDTEIIASATFKEITAEPKTFTVTVTEKVPVVGGSVYTFKNDKTQAQNMGTWTSEQFMAHVEVDGGEIITGMKDVTNAYIGGNGGSGDATWNIWDSLKIGKSSAKGEITLLLDGTASFSKIKVSAIGARDDGTLTINEITQNVTKKAIKGDLEPIELEYEIEGGITELKLSSKDAASNNYGIVITRIEFVGGGTPTPQKQLTNLVVKTQPSKVSYNEGETFNPAGMVLTATYSDDSTEDITSGWTISPNRPLTAADETVTVSFGGKSVTIDISVTARELVSIAITSGMSKTKYYVGDSWSASGIVVTGTYNIGDPAPIDSSKYSLVYDPTAPAIGVTSVSIVASMNDGSKVSAAYNQTDIVVEEKQQGDSYNLVKSNDDITEGQYLIVYGSKSFKGVDTGMNYATVSVENESIADDESLIYVEFEEMTGGFALKVVGGDNDGKYMYGSSSKNTIGFDAGKKLNTISVDDSGNATIVSETATFKFNTISGETNDRFRYYKPSTTPNADQVLPSLYKKGSTTPKKQISSVELQGDLVKDSYVAGQSFDPTGLSLKINYSDTTSEVISSGFTFDAVNPLAVGEYNIKASYKGFESTNSVHITVVAKAITALEIKSGMTKTAYVVDEDWAPAGIVVEATYNDGSKANLQSSDYTLEFDPTKPALDVEEVSIVAKVANGTTSAAYTQAVTVTEEEVAATLTGIAASGYTNTATVGQTYTFDGTVTASYSDGSSHAVTGYTWTTPISTASAGEKTGVISYTEGDVTKTCNVVVTVAEAHENTVKIAYEAAVPKTSGATDPLTFTGVVSAIQGNSFVVADGDYGILIYNHQVSGIDVGKTITVKATLKNYKGLIESDSVTSATLGAAGIVPTPVNVTSVSQLNGLKTNVLINCVQLEVVSKESTWSSGVTNNWNVKLAGSSVVLSLNKFVFDSAKSAFLKGLNVGDVFSASNLTVGCYNNVNQLSVMRDTTFQAGPAKEITSLGQVTAPESIGKGGTLSVSDVSVAVTYDDTTTGSVHPDRIELDTSTVAESVTGTVYVGDLSTTFTIKVEEAAQTKTALFDYATTKDVLGSNTSGWADKSFTLQGNTFMVHSMGVESPNAFTWNANAYLYQTVSTGKIKSIKIKGTSGKSVNIFLSNTAFSAKASGTATVSHSMNGSEQTISFTGDYSYIAINGAASSTKIITLEIVYA